MTASHTGKMSETLKMKRTFNRPFAFPSMSDSERKHGPANDGISAG